MSAEDIKMIEIDRAAHLAEITIYLPPLGAPYRAEQVMGFLAAQRKLIAERIRRVAVEETQ